MDPAGPLLSGNHVGVLSGLALCVAPVRFTGGRKPADNACQLGVSTPTLRNLSAAFSTDSRHSDARLAAPCKTLRATSGCLFWIISKQSAQLPHLAASRILDALPNPIPPKVRSIDAAIFAFNGTGPIWSTLCKHCTNCSSWCEANSRVNSSRIVLNRKFALAAKQQEQPSGLDVLDVGNHLHQSVMFDPFLRQTGDNDPGLPDWCSQHRETLLTEWQPWVSAPNHHSLISLSWLPL